VPRSEPRAPDTLDHSDTRTLCAQRAGSAGCHAFGADLRASSCSPAASRTSRPGIGPTVSNPPQCSPTRRAARTHRRAAVPRSEPRAPDALEHSDACTRCAQRAGSAGCRAFGADLRADPCSPAASRTSWPVARPTVSNPPQCSSSRAVVRHQAKTVRIPPAPSFRTGRERCEPSTNLAERAGFEPAVGFWPTPA
jgi:hypothetical protein